MSEFWMVWNPENRQPRVRHHLEILAVNEAERLARANPGQQFFVLRATSVSKVELPSITKRLEPEMIF